MTQGTTQGESTVLSNKIEKSIRNYTRNITGKEVEDIQTKLLSQPIKQLEYVVEHIISDVKLECSDHTEDNKIMFSFTRKNYGYMMATHAFHLLGDISSGEPDLCSIYGETKGYYIGSWITGYGFFNVMFPKSTTRPLNDDEVDYWSGRHVAIGSQPSYGFNIDDLKASRKICEAQS